MAKRGAKGAGNIRKRTITRNGKQYTYWEGRVTTGRDPTTGKQVQRYFSAKTGISKKSAPCLAMHWRGALFFDMPVFSNAAQFHKMRGSGKPPKPLRRGLFAFCGTA